MRRRLALISVLATVGWSVYADAKKEWCPLIPMVAITGRPDEKTVRETLEAYKAVGIDQYLIGARSGYGSEYMGEEWLQVCEWFAQHAKRMDMGLWLCDEFNGPSGSCKGKVPAENPEYEFRQYVLYKIPSGGYDWQVCHSPGFVDNYNAKAMERFIELTHKKYQQRLGAYLGNTIKGIFTDEPAHPAFMKILGKPALVFRYVDGVEDDYKAKTGRSLRSDVELFLSDNTKDEVWAIYAELTGTRLRSAFFDPIRKWCDGAGVFSTGHLIAENSTAESAVFNGSPLRVLKGLSLTGMDEMNTRVDPAQIEWLTLATAQHGIVRKENGGLAELFALGPCDQTLAVQRQMIWLCAFHKVDRYVLAIAPLDARGNAEKSASFNTFSRMQPWFPALRMLGDESRIAAKYASKPVRCSIAIRYPQAETARLAAKKLQHPALTATLRRFSELQLTYDLYEEDETCEKPLIFTFAGSIIKEERSKREFNVLDEAAAFSKTVMPPAAWVETAEGKPVEDVLLRCYQDGSVAVLSLSGEDHGTLLLKRPGQPPLPFALAACGIYYSERNEPVPEQAPKARPFPPNTTFGVALSKCNSLRLAFGRSNAARIKNDQPIGAVRLVVRDYPTRSAVTLDGKPMAAEQPCDALQQGFNELYRQTAPFLLAAGEHVVRITAGGSDTNYFLPVAFAAGAFATDGNAVKPLPKSVDAGALWQRGLGEFSGSVTYLTSAEVPAHAKALRLRLQTGGLYTSVSINGKPLGERAWAPFEWTVPVSVKGTKAELSVTVWTSIGPMFGDTRLAPSTPGMGKSPLIPAAHPEVGLLAPPEWLLEK